MQRMTVAASKFKSTEAKKSAGTTGGGGGGGVVVPDPTDKAYGIRSHIHEFYDWRGVADSSELGAGDAWYLIPPSASIGRRRLVYLFRALTVLGLLLLVAGAVLILVGFMWPRESPASIWERLGEQQQQQDQDDGDRNDDKSFVEAVVNLLEDKMRPWKLAGLVVFACGGTILAVSLLVPTCARLFGREALSSDLNTPVEPPVKIFPATPPIAIMSSTMGGGDPKLASSGGSPPASPTERRVPAVEAISSVQPKATSGTDGGHRRKSGDELLLLEDEGDLKRT